MVLSLRAMPLLATVCLVFNFYACLFCTFICSHYLLLFWFAAVARSGENSLFGSSPIDQVCVVATIFILIYGISLS
jgi:hypothetical protein